MAPTGQAIRRKRECRASAAGIRIFGNQWQEHLLTSAVRHSLLPSTYSCGTIEGTSGG